MEERVKYLHTIKIFYIMMINQNQNFLEKYQTYFQQIPWKQKQKQINIPLSYRSKQSISQKSQQEFPIKLLKKNQEKQFNLSREKTPDRWKTKIQDKNKKVITPVKKTFKKTQVPNVYPPRKSLSPVNIPINNHSLVSPISITPNSKRSNNTNNRSHISGFNKSSKLVQQKNINNNNAFQKLSELVFTIKMTKQQYTSFIKMKKQAQRI